MSRRLGGEGRAMEQPQKSNKKVVDKKAPGPDPDAGIMTLLRDQTKVVADQDIYSTASRMERTIFVVDLSKLEAEGDTLVGALVLYQPEIELKKSRYEQRCSQLIGLALCMKNYSKKYPKYIHLKGSGFAVRSLGGVYLMGLSSRLEEPSTCVVSLAELIHSIFQFYYHSPDHVLQSCNNDWSKFTAVMSGIFSGITDFVAKDKHSVPAMFRPLPYIDTSTCKKRRQELYLVSNRVLRSCQNLDPVIGGCIMYNSKLVLSQFPSGLTEMLIVLGSGVADLKRQSILKEGMVPDKVWLVHAYLTTKQKKVALHNREVITTLQETHNGFSANPHLSSSTLQFRFQPSTSLTSTGAFGGSKQVKKQTWSRRTHKNRVSFNTASSRPGGSRRRVSSGRSASVLSANPVSTSTPQHQQQQQQHQEKNARTVSDSTSMMSVDAVLVSPGLETVSFNNDHIKGKRKAESRSRQEKRKSQPDFPHGEGPDWAGGGAMNETDELYLDAVAEVNPAMALGPEMLRLFSNSSTSDEKDNRDDGKKLELRLNSGSVNIPHQQQPMLRVAHGTGSTSSGEGFATPSPTPPHRSSVIGMAGRTRDESTGPDIASSFQTANESFFCGTEDEEVEKIKGQLDSLTTREASSGATATVQPVRSDRDPPSSRRRRQDSDDDFIDSKDLDVLIERVRLKTAPKESTDSPNDDTLHLEESLAPPPPIPKRTTSFTSSSSPATQRSSAVFTPSETLPEVPPRPPPRQTSSSRGYSDQSDDSKLILSSLPSERPAVGSNEVDGDTDCNNSAPPIPPRLHISSSPEPILAGRLDGAIDIYGDQKMAGTPSDRKTGADSEKLEIRDNGLQSSWIYGTIGRNETTERMEEHRDAGNDSGDEKLELVDDPVPTKTEVSTNGMQVSAEVEQSGPPATSVSTEQEESVSGETGNSSDAADGSKTTVTIEESASGDQTVLPESNGTEPDVTKQTISSEVSAQDGIQNTSSAKNDSIATDVPDGPSAEKVENVASSVENSGDDRKSESQIENIEGNGNKLKVSREVEDHYEFDDYCIIGTSESGGAKSNAQQDGSPAAAVATPSSATASNSKQDEEHIYEFDDEDDDQNIEDKNKEGLANGKLSPSSQKRLEESRYEEIPEDIRRQNHGTGNRTESESSEGPVKADNEGGESKTSSMATVTLDLSHFDHNDPLYSSAGENRLSGSYSTGGSVEVPTSLALRSNSDVNSTASSEEAGRDGMVTPVEITYSESMFSQVREKMETSGHASNEDQAKTAVRREVDEDAMSNDSAEYSSLPDEDESLMMMNTRIATAAQKKSKNWLSRTMERPIFVSEGEEVIEKFSVYVQCYMDTYIILLTDLDIHKDNYEEDVLNELWRPLAEQLLYLDSILEDKKERIESNKVTNCIATYSSRERHCEAKPLSAAYHFRHAVRRAHQEYSKDPSLRQLSLSKEHCRMLSQNVHGREVYVQPSGCAGDAMCLHGLIERSMKSKTSLKQQPTGAPKVMLI